VLFQLVSQCCLLLLLFSFFLPHKNASPSLSPLCNPNDQPTPAIRACLIVQSSPLSPRYKAEQEQPVKTVFYIENISGGKERGWNAVLNITNNISIYTANEGPVRIQYKCIPRNETVISITE
jgi:hypothetical protein